MKYKRELKHQNRTNILKKEKRSDRIKEVFGCVIFVAVIYVYLFGLPSIF